MAADDTQPTAPRPGQVSTLAELERVVTSCRLCPRLVDWRERAGAFPPPAFRDERYWARPLPGFGDAHAQLLVVGLAPAANGGNRTGRMFTGDRSGDFLFAALHRAGFANQPESQRRDDGLVLQGCYITAAVRCAPPQNRPTPDERDRCVPYLETELALLTEVRVILALGAFAYDVVWRVLNDGSGAKRPFAHGVEAPVGNGTSRAWTLLCSYHPSQRNVFTGLLRPEMLDAVLSRARDLLS